MSDTVKIEPGQTMSIWSPPSSCPQPAPPEKVYVHVGSMPHWCEGPTCTASEAGGAIFMLAAVIGVCLLARVIWKSINEAYQNSDAEARESALSNAERQQKLEHATKMNEMEIKERDLELQNKARQMAFTIPGSDIPPAPSVDQKR